MVGGEGRSATIGAQFSTTTSKRSRHLLGAGEVDAVDMVGRRELAEHRQVGRAGVGRDLEPGRDGAAFEQDGGGVERQHVLDPQPAGVGVRPAGDHALGVGRAVHAVGRNDPAQIGRRGVGRAVAVRVGDPGARPAAGRRRSTRARSVCAPGRAGAPRSGCRRGCRRRGARRSTRCPASRRRAIRRWRATAAITTANAVASSDGSPVSVTWPW